MLGEGQPKSFGAETAFELPYLATHGERDLELDGAVLVPGGRYPAVYDRHHGIVVPPNIILVATRLEHQHGAMSGDKDEFMYRGITLDPYAGCTVRLNLPETDRLPDPDPAKWAEYREWFIKYQPEGTYTMLPWQTVFTVTPPDDFRELAALHAQNRLPTRSPGAPVVRQNVFSFN